MKTSDRKTRYPEHESTTLDSFGERISIAQDGSTIYQDHDPHCIIYLLGSGHCNCSEPDENFEEDDV